MMIWPQPEPTWRSTTLAPCDALAAGTEDVYPGEMSSSFEQALRQDPKQLEHDVTEIARQVLNAAAAN